MPTTGLTPSDAEKFRRQVTTLLMVLVFLVVGLLGTSMVAIYTRVVDTQRQITDAVERGPEETTKALCRIFETFDRLSEYHGFPPATDEATRRECARLLDG